MLVALTEAFARRSGVDPEDLWDYLYRQKAPPPDLRDAIVEAFYPAVRPEDFLLPSSPENDTLDTMNATAIAPPRRGRPLENRDHPFVAALLREGLTVAEVAEELKRRPSTVKAWYKASSDPGFRPIPRDVAKVISKRFKVPLSAWARIAD